MTELPGMGPPGWFTGVFVLGVIAVIGMTIYRIYMARHLAEKSGMDRRDATAMTLLDEDGLTATYLAANLKNPSGTGQADTRPVAERLAELQGLLDQGLISEAEFESVRQQIIESI